MHAWYSHHSLRFPCFSSFLLLSLHDPLADPLFVFSPLPSMPMLRLVNVLYSSPLFDTTFYEFPRSEPSDYVQFVYRTFIPFPFPQHLFFFPHHHRFCICFNYPRSLHSSCHICISVVLRRPIFNERLPRSDTTLFAS